MESFRLYNRTVVSPLQDDIIGAFDKILGVENSITISPFNIQWDEAVA
jgi:hypothetical protein